MMLGVFWCVLKFPSLHGLFFEHLFCPLLLDAFLTSWCSLSVSCMSEGGAEKLMRSCVHGQGLMLRGLQVDDKQEPCCFVGNLPQCQNLEVLWFGSLSFLERALPECLCRGSQ